MQSSLQKYNGVTTQKIALKFGKILKSLSMITTRFVGGGLFLLPILAGLFWMICIGAWICLGRLWGEGCVNVINQH